MLSCEECRQQLYPTDPTQRWYNRITKRYSLSLCETCPQYMSLEYRIERLEKETPLKEPKAEKWTPKTRDTVDQFRCQVSYLNRRLSDLEKQVKERPAKRGKYKDYKVG